MSSGASLLHSCPDCPCNVFLFLDTIYINVCEELWCPREPLYSIAVLTVHSHSCCDSTEVRSGQTLASLLAPIIISAGLCGSAFRNRPDLLSSDFSFAKSQEGSSYVSHCRAGLAPLQICTTAGKHRGPLITAG